MSKKTSREMLDPESMLPLTPTVFHILLSLVDGERHGYSIMQDVANQTDGSVRLGAGSLYGALKRLIEQGMIEESDSRPDPEEDDERRRYYRLTDFGGRVTAGEAKRLASLVKIARAKRLFQTFDAI